MSDLHTEFQARMVQQIHAAQKKLYWQMIAAGQLPSQGWTLGEELKWEGPILRYRCWPVPPLTAAP